MDKIMNTIMQLAIVLGIISLNFQFYHCVPPTVKDAGCVVGAYRFGDRCYSFFSVNADFQNAQFTCETTGGQLATVRDVNDWGSIVRLIIFKTAYRYWIGVNDKGSEGQFASGDSNPLVFTNWQEGEPNGGVEQNCVTTVPRHSFRWTTEPCGASHSYVCQIRTTQSSCASGQFLLGNFCYQAFEERVTATVAGSKCAQLGGFLADPKTDSEHNAIVSSIDLNRSWQNLATSQFSSFAFQPGAGLYIGIVRRNGLFVNTDGSTPFFQWDQNEPNNAGGAENCVAISPSLKKNDFVCASSLNFICSHPAAAVTLG